MSNQDIGAKGFVLAALILSIISVFLPGPFLYLNVLALILAFVGIFKGIREKNLWSLWGIVALIVSIFVFSIPELF